MIRRIISGLLSSVIFCSTLALGAYVQGPHRGPDTYNSEPSEMMVLYLIFATPVFLLGGIPCSILIDHMSRRIRGISRFQLYLLNLMLYALAGVLMLWLFFLILTKGHMTLQPYTFSGFLEMGIIPSLLFYHLHLLVRKRR
jgi:hypothetical protein